MNITSEQGTEIYLQVSDKIFMVKIKSKPTNRVIIQVYMSISIHDDEETE